MNVMTARAKRIENGAMVVGQPMESEGRLFLVVQTMVSSHPIASQPDVNLLHIVNYYEVDPATLGYATGKLDKNKEMIYGGMEVNVHRFAFKDCIYKVMFCNIKLSWILIDGSYWLYLCQFESKDLKIMGEKEG